MRIVARGAAWGALRTADLELAPGRYVVLSNEREPLQSLIALLAGQQPPRSGQLLIDGEAPAQQPTVRRKLAALFADEALPPAKTLLKSIGKALGARGASPDKAGAVLEQASLANLANLAPSALDSRELRSAALALALAHDTADLFVMYEPLTTLVPASTVLQSLDQHTARGAIVLTATTSPADATLLGGRWLCIELGRLRSLDTGTPRLGPGPWQEVLVETDDASALSQLLHDSPHGLSTELGLAPQLLKVSGPSLDVTVHELVTLARKHGVEIRRIEATTPPVDALLAARAGLARGAYEASRAAALGPGGAR